MINKSIRLTKEDAAGVQMIIEEDSRVEKGQSQALYYAFKDAAEDIPDWEEIAKEVMQLKTDYVVKIPYGVTKTFSVEEKYFNIVIDSIKSQLNLETVRVSYAARLCILAYHKRKKSSDIIRINAYNKRVNKKVDLQEVDPTILFGKILELYSNKTDENKRLLMKVAEVLGI